MTDLDRRYAQKRPELAWHVIAFHTRGLNTWKTICGRTAVDPVVDVLPVSGHACGSCTRNFIRDVDPEDNGSTWTDRPQL